MLVKGKVQPELMKICQADFSLQAANQIMALQLHMEDKEMSSGIRDAVSQTLDQLEMTFWTYLGFHVGHSWENRDIWGVWGGMLGSSKNFRNENPQYGQDTHSLKGQWAK